MGSIQPEPSLKGLTASLASKAADYDSTASSSMADKMDMLGVIRQISTSLMDPGTMVQSHCLQMADLVCIRTLLSLKVFEYLFVDGESVGLDELSEKTGVEDKLLERLLRVVVGTGFVKQDSQGRYGGTEVMKGYLSYAGMFFTLMHDEFLAPMTELPAYLKKHGGKEPTSLYLNPYSDYFNASEQGLTTWDIMSRDPERIKVFQQGLGIADNGVPTTGFFDFGQYDVDKGDRMSLVDIGGGIGNKTKLILEASPSLKPERCMVQDQPNIIEMATKNRVVPEGVKLVVNNFWDGQPVKGAKAYYIRRVLHDYSDDDCIKILSHVKEAMAPDSRLLIAEQILPTQITNPEMEANVAVLDVACMVMGGKERTEENFKMILDGSGLELVKIWRAPHAPAGIVEAKLKGS